MCGVVLVLNKKRNGFTADQRDLFTTLLFVDTLRGKDSTGAALINNIGNVVMAKQVGPAQNFIDTPEYEKLTKEAWDCGWAMIGHNRAATRGVISDENAHPFIVDEKIVLVHNGTFHGDHKKLKDTAVDSEAIAHMLSEHEPEEALRKVDAAYALIWYNVDEKSINFIRNNQRPLWYAETDDTIVVTSEESIIRFGLARHNMVPLKDHGPYLLKDHHFVQFKLKDDKSTEHTESKTVDVEYSKHNPPERYMGYGGWSSHRSFRGYHGHWGEYDNDVIDIMGEVVGTNERNRVETLTPSQILHQEEVWGTKGHFQRNVVIESLGKKAMPSTWGEWQDLQNVFYKDVKKLKVVVDDLVEADENPKTSKFIMIGRTLDDHNVQVVFPMTTTAFDSLNKMTEDTIFEIDFNGITWQQVDHIKNNEEVVTNTTKGTCLLHGVNPKPILTEVVHA